MMGNIKLEHILLILIALAGATFGIFKNTIPDGNERMVVAEMEIRGLQKHCCGEQGECK